MLKICNELKPFFNDVFREISVREYAREMKVSPPTASTRLQGFEKEGLLLSRKHGMYLYFRAHRSGYIFPQLAKLYWHGVLFNLTKKLKSDVAFRQIILFGSLAKAENTQKSDIDLYLDAPEREVDVSKIEKTLHRSVQLHFITSMKNPHLKKNIEDGVVIR